MRVKSGNVSVVSTSSSRKKLTIDAALQQALAQLNASLNALLLQLGLGGGTPTSDPMLGSAALSTAAADRAVPTPPSVARVSAPQVAPTTAKPVATTAAS